MASYVLDTHTLLLFLAGSPSLGKLTEAAMLDMQSALILPAIALAEALWIVDSRELGVGSEDVLAAVDGDPRLSVYPLTRELVGLANSLKSIGEMHDRQVVATTQIARRQSPAVVLLTKDENIVGSGLVRTAW